MTIPWWLPTKEKEPTYVFMQEDTAGRKYYSEFVASCTGPIKTWVEGPDFIRYYYIPKNNVKDDG